MLINTKNIIISCCYQKVAVAAISNNIQEKTVNITDFLLIFLLMSLGIIIKAPEGLVLAAESRITLTSERRSGNPNMPVEKTSVNFDNANKLLTFSEPYNRFGLVTYGQAAIGLRTPQSLIPEFETKLDGKPLSVSEFAEKLSQFFSDQWKDSGMPKAEDYKGHDMIFNVAGFDEHEPYGKIFQFEIPKKPIPFEQQPKVNDQHQFGVTGGGQHEIMSRLMLGYDPQLLNILIKKGILSQAVVRDKVLPALEPLKLQAPIQFMPLQDCINLALMIIRTTIDAQSLSVGLRGCGGAIDIAIITKGKELKFIKQKNITAN